MIVSIYKKSIYISVKINRIIFLTFKSRSSAIFVNSKPIIFESAILQEIQYYEFFAGVGNVTKRMKLARYRAARFDILDYVPNGRKSNYMDLNSSSGYAFLC